MTEFKKDDRVRVVRADAGKEGTIVAVKGDGLYAVVLDGLQTRFWYYKTELEFAD